MQDSAKINEEAVNMIKLNSTTIDKLVKINQTQQKS